MTSPHLLVQRYAQDRQAFRMDCRTLEEGRSYRQTCEAWQEDQVFKPVGSGKHAFLQLPRGHDKTGSIAWLAIEWLLFGRTEERIVVCAADKEQARLDLDEIRDQTIRTPWLGTLLKITRNVVTCESRRSRLTVMAADEGSSYGLRPTRVIIEELHAWSGTTAEKLWDSLWGSIAKRKAQVVVLTNAGAGRDWKWDRREVFRQMAEEDPEHWHFWAPEGWVAGFADQEILARGMTPLSRSRFIENRWLAEAENSFLTGAQVDTCLTDYAPIEVEREFPHRAQGVDLGLTKDAASVAVVGCTEGGDYALLSMDVFVGSKEEPVDLASVGEIALENVSRWDLVGTVLDPWQAQYLHQQLGGRLLSEIFHFGGSSVRELTEVAWQIMSRGRFQFWKGAGAAMQQEETWDLEREMRSAILKSMSYGERLDHDSGGYSDRLISVSLALWKLVRWLGESADDQIFLG